VSAIETGRLDRVRVAEVLALVEVLGGHIDFVVRWQGGELDRLINSRHGALHESVARYFRAFSEWQIAPEVSFNVYGERGVIDILAWHPATQTLLVIELKTEVVDISELMGTLDKKTRLAPTIARERGWHPVRIGVWVIVADSSMNRRRVQKHATTLRAALPGDSRRLAAWLRQPESQLRCLSFWANDAGERTNGSLATPKRIRPRSRKPLERKT